MKVKDLSAHLGVTQSSVSPRAATLLRAGGFDTSSHHVGVESSDCLIAARRRRVP